MVFTNWLGMERILLCVVGLVSPFLPCGCRLLSLITYDISKYCIATLPSYTFCVLLFLLKITLIIYDCSFCEKLICFLQFYTKHGSVCWLYLCCFTVNYVPELSELSNYILRVACNVTWTDEQLCFQTFCRETAKFYSKPPHRVSNVRIN